MKTIEIEVLKKNRKYFACRTKNGYKARLIIDENSKDLSLGKQELPVNDKSKRTKYGTDIILELAAEASEIENAGIVTLEHHLYNSELVEECKNLGGKWDAEEQCWIFSDIVADRVEYLDDLYNSELISIEITTNRKYDDGDLKHIFGEKAPVDFLGYTIARARGRDSGAKLGDNISLMSGKIRSGGSVKNWDTVVDAGSVFRLKVPSKLIDIYLNDDDTIGDWKVKKL